MKFVVKLIHKLLNFINPSKTLKIALALLGFAILLSGCPADPGTPSKKPDPNILRFDTAYRFGPFAADPHVQAGSHVVFPFMFSYLAVPDQDGNLQPDLAEKWTYDETTFTWTFDLRNNVRFHDAKPVTARDAVFSLKMVLEPLLPELYARIRSLNAVSDTKLQIRLYKNDPKFPEKIRDIEIFQSPPNPDLLPEEFLIGSGPFVLKEKNAQRIVLEANPNYYRGKPAINGMVFTFVPDQENIWARLMGGQTDVAQAIVPENVPLTEACADRFYINRYSMPYYTMLLFNTHDPLLSDLRVRKALALAVNREHIVEKILHGNGAITSGPMGLDPRFHNPRLAPVSYDPPEALELLAEAGWQYDSKGRSLVKDGKFLEFTTYVAEEFPTHQRVAQYLRLCFNDIGIRLQVHLMPFNKLVKSFSGNTDFQLVITHAQFPSPSFRNLKVLWSKTGDACSMCGGFEDARVSALLEALDAQSDPEAQKDLFYAIEARILDLAPAAFLYSEIVYDVMSRRFDLPGPFYLYPDMGWNLQFASLKKGFPGN